MCGVMFKIVGLREVGFLTCLYLGVETWEMLDQRYPIVLLGLAMCFRVRTANALGTSAIHSSLPFLGDP